MSEYVRNAWYPIAWSREIGRTLVARRLLEEDIVLYRIEAGAVVALEDACPHRMLPLSMGKLKGDAIECGYHGMTFDCSGKCIRIPGQPIIPPNAIARSYPARENMGLVWIWMGEPELADGTPLFDLPQYHDPAWSVAEGDALRIEANYLSLADNLCDPSHVSFVHLSTLGNAASEGVPVQCEKSEGKVLTWRWIMDAPPIPLFKKFGNFKGNVDRWHYYHFYAPSIAVIDFGSITTGHPLPESARGEGIRIFACHFITPVDENTSIDHWLHVKNFQASPETNKALSDEFRIAFAEDKGILEAIHQNERKPRAWQPIKLGIDASPIRMRKLVSHMIEVEENPNPA